MITLFDNYNQKSWDLHYSLFKAGYVHPTVVIEDDGFLPHDVVSPYSFFTGYDLSISNEVYFNQVPVPDFWEIRGNNSEAQIYDYHRKRGHIYYASPSHKRLVKKVEWYDESGRTRHIDHYNRQGYRFAQTHVDQNKKWLFTSYFSSDGQEVITENHLSGNITLNYLGNLHFFKNKTAFVRFFLENSGFELDRIFYNSLSTPFFVTRSLGIDGRDILFWDEPINTDLPGNMKALLTNPKRHTEIAVQKPDIYQKMVPLLSAEELSLVKPLGYIYHITQEKDLQKDKKALILTNSDNISTLEDLVLNYPNLEFHIGAITEMSSKLMNLGRYDNVTLYPNISTQKVNDLYNVCQLYLDINYGNEILSAVRTAFERGLLILGYYDTVHEPNYIGKSALFTQDSGQLQITLTKILNNHDFWKELLTTQRQSAGLVTIPEFQKIVG